MNKPFTERGDKGSPVGHERGRAADAEERAGEQVGAVFAAVEAVGDVLVVHDQRRAVGHRLLPAGNPLKQRNGAVQVSLLLSANCAQAHQ